MVDGRACRASSSSTPTCRRASWQAARGDRPLVPASICGSRSSAGRSDRLHDHALLVTLVVLFSATWVGLLRRARHHRADPAPRRRDARGRAGRSRPAHPRRGRRRDRHARHGVQPHDGGPEDAAAPSSTRAAATSRSCSRTSPPASSRPTPTGRITTMNRAAAALLGVDRPRRLDRDGGSPRSSPAPAHARGCGQMVADLVHDDTRDAAVRLGRAPARARRATGARWRCCSPARGSSTRPGTPQGVVLFLEDVTHLLRVQRMEAWREVARRIAHEIKNPLTPIQLSAQRLRRRYAHQLADGRRRLRRVHAHDRPAGRGAEDLVNEFSTFARMPAARARARRI